MYIVISYPYTCDASIDEYKKIEDALEKYKDALSNDASPILTKKLVVEIRVYVGEGELETIQV